MGEQIKIHESGEMNIQENNVQEEISRIFSDLFTFTCEELDNLGIKAEPGEVIHRLISPLKEAYIKSFSDFFWSFAKAKKMK